MAMRIVVDLELCQGHGVCAGEAPDVFRVVTGDDSYDHVEVLAPVPDGALQEKVESAIKYCPNRVISLLEED
jgi:ferredoxin